MVSGESRWTRRTKIKHGSRMALERSCVDFMRDRPNLVSGPVTQGVNRERGKEANVKNASLLCFLWRTSVIAKLIVVCSAKGMSEYHLRKAATKADAAVLKRTCGAKKARAFKVVGMFWGIWRSLLQSSRLKLV